MSCRKVVGCSEGFRVGGSGLSRGAPLPGMQAGINQDRTGPCRKGCRRHCHHMAPGGQVDLAGDGQEAAHGRGLAAGHLASIVNRGSLLASLVQLWVGCRRASFSSPYSLAILAPTPSPCVRVHCARNVAEGLHSLLRRFCSNTESTLRDAYRGDHLAWASCEVWGRCKDRSSQSQLLQRS